MPYPPAGPVRPSWGPDDVVQSPPFEAFFVPPPRPKFRHRWWLHIVLFLLTLASTTLIGLTYYVSYVTEFTRHAVTLGSPAIKYGLYYSLTVLAILGAHEFGHYYYCRRYNIDASLPYFIPAPFIALTGTLGAVIRIREQFPTRTALFDVGVAGPIAGFVVLVPALFIGMSMSEVAVAPTGPNIINFGEPLLFQWAAYMFFGDIAANQTINCHPMVFAAWFGMFATALNLLPFGQLDGGHIAYATLGPRATLVSVGTVGLAIILTYNSLSWLFVTVMMLLMLFLFGARHPRVTSEYEPLPASRIAVALFAVVMLVVCFTPVPIEILFQ